MKNIIKNTSIFILANSLGFMALAQDKEQIVTIQNNSDIETLQELSSRFSREFTANRQRISEIAKLKNWPLEIRKEDGSISLLRDVQGDTPLYITTTDVRSAVTSRVDKIQRRGTLSLNGNGMLAGIWEPGLPLKSHLDFGGRVTGPGDNSKLSIYTHTTHVAGIIASSGENSTDYNGKGIAYKSNVKFWDCENDIAEMAVAASEGLLVSNHSYGTDLSPYPNDEATFLRQFGSYQNDAKNLDDVTFAAPYYQPVFSAGNDRTGYFSGSYKKYYNPTKEGYDLLTSYCTAKNALVVAAVFEVPSYTNYQSVTMSSFSDWGPTDDNRIKPDISACGISINSTVCGSGSNPNANNLYGKLSGTSMASPGVAGVLLLIQQHFSNLNNKNFMRSATARGLVAHCADEAGYYDGPDARFGWGLINAERMANVITNKAAQKSIMLESNLAQGDSYSTTVYSLGDTPLIATLSWTDKGGTANNTETDLTTPALVNDLDIRITKDGQTYFPWRLSNSLKAAAETGDNIVDNVEKVELKLPESGLYTITVSHKGSLTGESQNYSLIVSGIDQSSLGIEQNDFKQFSVWPNPVNEIVNISVATDLNDDAIATVYDALGKKVKEQKLNNSTNGLSGEINTSDLNPGIYLVKVVQGEKQSTKKIIKK